MAYFDVLGLSNEIGLETDWKRRSYPRLTSASRSRGGHQARALRLRSALLRTEKSRDVMRRGRHG